MKKNIVAYLMPGVNNVDTTLFTHANYAFAYVTEDAIAVRSNEDFKRIADLRKDGNFKLLASLQQRGRTVFCTRSKTAEGRALIAKQCKEMLDEFDLDGIDVDWEYPGIDLTTGEDNCDTCRDDFIALLQAIRDAIGSEKLLTIACGATPDTWRHTDFVRAAQILDYINIMGYDYNWNKFGKAHHSNLYPPSVGIGIPTVCGDACIQMMFELGIPAEKLVLGLPLYGYQAGKGADGFLRYNEITDLAKLDNYSIEFDEAAKQSYLTRDGEMFVGFDDPKTIEIKAAYIKEKGLAGMMYWQYALDDDENTLKKAAAAALWGE